MNDTDSVQNIQQKITAIKDQLLRLERMRPGSLSRQYNTCGKAGCRCKDPEKPKRHGPYYQLNYVFRGKKKSQFIRATDVASVRAELATFKKFRQLTGQWIALALERADLELKPKA
jgi:hypothetical protein